MSKTDPSNVRLADPRARNIFSQVDRPVLIIYLLATQKSIHQTTLSLPIKSRYQLRLFEVGRRARERERGREREREIKNTERQQVSCPDSSGYWSSNAWIMVVSGQLLVPSCSLERDLLRERERGPH